MAIVGATGSTGREIVRHAVEKLKDGRRAVKELTLITRSRLAEWDEWEKKDPWFKKNVKIIVKDNFETIPSVLQEKIKNYDCFMCALGGPTKQSQSKMQATDHRMPVAFARLAKQVGIPYYGLISS